LVDPEAYDTSEQQFAASLEERSQARFVVEREGGVKTDEAPANVEDQERGDASVESLSPSAVQSQNSGVPAGRDIKHLPVQLDQQEEQDPDRWRQEVATRLNNYRARRRPRAPRYPSLRLKFEADEVRGNTVGSVETPGSAMGSRPAVAVESFRRTHPSFTPAPDTVMSAKNIESKMAESKVIEFPRLSAAPSRVDDLADPVLDRPRILEAPELAPPPPALGGILIESAEELPTEKRPGFEIPLQSAPMLRRLAAVAIDGAVVLSAVALFAYVFLKITRHVPPAQPVAGAFLVLMGLFWIAYQYLLVVYCGTTPGLKLAGLLLCRFDGKTAPRPLRRWRILASVLSGVSLGLGYAWCFLDEDQLCWHDRITHTYMAPKHDSTRSGAV
jgi:hypothetical protein